MQVEVNHGVYFILKSQCLSFHKQDLKYDLPSKLTYPV